MSASIYSICRIRTMTTPSGPANVEGFVKDGFERVRDVFRENLENGTDEGGSVAVYYEGELVVNLWGGWVDKDSCWKWREDTMPCVFSTTKGPSALVIAHLVDRGLLDYKEKISKYWPEFGQNGKEEITLETYITNKAGLSGTDEPFSLWLIQDDPLKFAEILAKQKPLWEPDIEFYIGLPKELYYRAPPDLMMGIVENTELLNGAHGDDPELTKMVNASFTDVLNTNNPYVREVPLGSALGHGTAASLAKLHGILANGGVHQGKRMMSEEAIKRQQVPRSYGKDAVYGMDWTFSLGTMVLASLDDDKPPEFSFGHIGHGGQMAFADPTHKIGFAYATNHLNADLVNEGRWKDLYHAMYECVYKIKKISAKRKLFLSYEELLATQKLLSSRK
ncbi:beta-lactamase domain-containing protein 2-like isoform X2 [Argopecten irradians]|uniref:beta-lactamase domain-containing protein 2-like isoform X2 n=1 Tax=Argopecten irradians TaxID=31199 RepID=UPI00371ED866